MKTKKLLVTALSTFGFAAGLSACGNKNVTITLPDKTEGFVIGILQPVEHPALEAARNGFEESLNEKIGKGKFEIKYLNAGGNDADLQLDAQTLVDECDMTFGIGTGAAQALKNSSIAKGYTKPVIFSAVTDPVDAKLVENKDAPEGFVTGSSDMNPVDDQIELIQEIIPTVKKIGVLYTQSEINSKVQSDMAKAKAESLGLEVVVKTCQNTSDITSTASALVQENVEAIFIPTDNNIASNMNAVKSAADQAHVLVMCGEEGMIKSGGHVTLSIDYKELGKHAGVMAGDILLKNKTVSESPVKYMTSEECTYVLSSSNLADAGITIPESVMSAHDWSDVK
ncbi:MAG: ABC transporter substrate-binding protein [Bacilli bacterium]|nr:ABC transporter substrate-binding protein [Bacilli bacterium]